MLLFEVGFVLRVLLTNLFWLRIVKYKFWWWFSTSPCSSPASSSVASQTLYIIFSYKQKYCSIIILLHVYTSLVLYDDWNMDVYSILGQKCQVITMWSAWDFFKETNNDTTWIDFPHYSTFQQDTSWVKSGMEQIIGSLLELQYLAIF